MAEVSVAADVRLALGESPVWVARTRTLHFVDIPAGALYSLRPGGALSGPFKVGAVVGAVVPRAAGGLLACLDHTVVPVGEDGAPAGGPLCSVAPVEGMRFNDAKARIRSRRGGGCGGARSRAARGARPAV